MRAFLCACTGLTQFNRDKIVQITEALLAEPGDIRRFVQQAVDHRSHLLAVHFTLHSAGGNINGQQIQTFCTSFYRHVHERITERNHTASPASPVVLRWLREQHEGAPIRCLLLLSQAFGEQAQTISISPQDFNGVTPSAREGEQMTKGGSHPAYAVSVLPAH